MAVHDLKKVLKQHAISYSTMIKACAGAGDVAEAEHLLCIMLNTGIGANMQSAMATRSMHVQGLAMWPKLSVGCG